MLHKVQPGITLDEGIRAVSKAAGTYDTTGIYVGNILGQILWGISAGTFGGGATLDAKVQESDDDVTYTDVAGLSMTQMLAAGYTDLGARVQQIAKKYVRLRITVAVAAVVVGVSQVYVPSNVQ